MAGLAGGQRPPGRDVDVHARSARGVGRSEEHTSELQSLAYLVCRLLLEKKKKKNTKTTRLNSSDSILSDHTLCCKRTRLNPHTYHTPSAANTDSLDHARPTESRTHLSITQRR